jgi:hypothetical protein
VKVEATAHLLGHLAHPLTLVLAGALATTAWLGAMSGLPGWVHGLGLSFAVLPFVTFYSVAGWLRRVELRRLLRRVPEALGLGIALGVPLSRAVLRGLLGPMGESPFRRTPKRGGGPARYLLPLRPGRNAARLLLGLALLAACWRQASTGVVAALPFTFLFALSYLASAAESVRPSGSA